MPKKKQAKPYADFPLFLHASGQWAKKIMGRMVYFGTDAKAAAAKYDRDRERLHSGLPPQLQAAGMTVKDLVNRFLTSKRSLMDSGELSPRTWRDYYACCERLVKALGNKTPIVNLGGEHFERFRAKLAKKRGPVSLGNEIQRVRTIFKFAFEEGLIEKPVRFGATFKKPNRRAVRRARNAGGLRLFEAADLHVLLGAASPALKAMILLGVNCGFGNHDVATLPIAGLDLKGGWVEFPRPKTEIARRCPLWQETVAAIRAAAKIRPKHKRAEDAGLVFITKYGWRWVRMKERKDKATGVPVDSVGLEFGKLLRAANLKRPGLGFYALRHTFRTIADGSKDQVAVNSIMGHTDESMAARYRERIDDERLKAVTEVVRTWLFAVKK